MTDAVILGAIEMRARTDLRGLRVCLASLRAHNPDARMVLVNRSPSHEPLARLLDEYWIETHDPQEDAGPPEVEIARFGDYGVWLRDHDVAGVLMIDVLDVVFQGDPFAAIPEQGIVAWQEHQRIGACPYNSKWMREVWGRERLDLLERPVVCCGVIAAEADAARAYLGWYEHHRETRTVRRGYDTAMLAGYVYGSLDAHVEPFHNHICMHLGYAPPESVEWQAGQITCHGLSPLIVHQYNRHHAITQEVRARWI